MPILHHISANSHTCWSDAITFVGSVDNVEMTLPMCYNLGLIRFSLLEIGGLYKFSVPICKIFQFRPILSSDKF